MLPTFIYHKKHVINLYISDEVLSTWGFQMWHIINLYISKTLIYTFKRSNNISEGTYQLQGSKCDTLSIHTSMLSMCKPLINLCILEATCHAFIYLFIYGSVIVQASLTVRALAAPLFTVSIFIWSLYDCNPPDCTVLHNWGVGQSNTGGAVCHINLLFNL